jgi:hypothetical protein
MTLKECHRVVQVRCESALKVVQTLFLSRPREDSTREHIVSGNLCIVQRWTTAFRKDDPWHDQMIVLTPFDNKLLLPAPFQEDEGRREKLVCIAFLIPKGSAGI